MAETHTTSVGGGGSASLVPSVKGGDSDTSMPPSREEDCGVGDCSDGGVTDRDYSCPICMQVIKDAFLTACGHSYCYMCIFTHLRIKSDCPCCGRFLTTSLIFPNFALDKLLKKMTDQQFVQCASSSDQLCRALQKGCDMSVKDVDVLLTLLSEKKRKMEHEEAETNLQVLLEFLVCLRKRKLEELSEIQSDLEYIKEDIQVVQQFRTNFSIANNNYMMRLRMREDALNSRGICSPISRPAAGYCSTLEPTTSGRLHCRGGNHTEASLSSQELREMDGTDALKLQNYTPSERVSARKRQIQAQFADLQQYYLKKRRQWAKELLAADRRDPNTSNNIAYHVGLEDLRSVLQACTRYSHLRNISELRCGDFFHSANIVSSIEFDRDDELFATAGVSKRIKIFEFSSVVDEPAEVHCAVVDIATRSKLSCLSWNKYTKHHIASSDYEGIVTVWDVNTRQSVGEFEEHEKRAWSVDFSRTEPSLLVSGGDDCKVKVWCTRQESSALTIDLNANICSVKCNPGSSMHIAVGSADHHIHYYDLRNVSQPVHIFSGHRKAVSYVKFLTSHELASASTDSSLRLWDVNENKPLQIYRGHTNEKNFVGLTSNTEYLSCGSETNEVFVYHKAMSRPVARYRFSSSDLDDTDDERGQYFISAVGWKSDSPIIMAANSRGNIRVLGLAA